MTDEDIARMKAFYNSRSYDVTPDWKKSAEAAADPDDEEVATEQPKKE